MVLAKRRYSFICIKCSFRLGILRYCINRAEQKNDKNIADSKKRNEEINKTIVVIDKVSIKQSIYFHNFFLHPLVAPHFLFYIRYLLY